jgi:outer membrane protein assembly factor BamB
MRLIKLLALLITSTVVTLTTHGADSSQNWPAFRGPGSTGVTEGYPLPITWNADPDNEPEGVLWRAPVPGLGHSSPIVWGDRIFVCTAIPEGEEASLMVGRSGAPTAADDSRKHRWVIFCFDKSNGKKLWSKTAYEGLPRTTRHVKATQANTTLTVDGENLVAFFGSEGL